MWEFSEIDDDHAFNGYTDYKIVVSDSGRIVVYLAIDLIDQLTLKHSRHTIDEILQALRTQSQDNQELMKEILSIALSNNSDPGHSIIRLSRSMSDLDSLLNNIRNQGYIWNPTPRMN